MKLQPDGSYWGLHQWYQGYPICKLDSTLGKTAWRVLERVERHPTTCVSASALQATNCSRRSPPTEPRYGPSEYAVYHVTYGCFSQELTALLPTTSGTTSTGTGTGKSGVAGSKESLTFSPSNKKCLSLRLFKIHLLEPQYDPLKTVSITIGGRKFASTHKGDYVVAALDLKGLPKGAFTVKIKATTVLGNHLSDSRTYHTCAKKKLKPHNKLKLSKEQK